MEKILKEKIIKILAEFKWGKLGKDIVHVCSFQAMGINPCCGACPSCKCHDKIEEYADRILKLLK